MCGSSESCLILFTIPLVQGFGAIGWHEVIRERNTACADGGKFAPTFGDQVVFVLLWDLIISHD